MKIVVCPDSFKGSLSANEVTETVAKVLKENLTDVDVVKLPLSDGGEGTGEIMNRHGYPVIVKTEASDPLGRIIDTKYYTDEKHSKVFIESADIIGLPLLKVSERNPLKASSYGLGELIVKSATRGITDITVSLGGSATCDAGTGMLTAFRKYGFDYGKYKFKVIYDVNNPLIGENGAVNVFARQKGAREEDMPFLEERIINFAHKIIKEGICNESDLYREGAGAAGGLGFVFQAILNADAYKGIDFILETVSFLDEIKNADLIITGEGRIDSQSLMGKVLCGVYEAVKKENIPLMMIAGQVSDRELLMGKGLTQLFPISNKELTLEMNMKKEIAESNLKKTLKESVIPEIKKEYCKNK